eukprot:g7214.t1
MLFVRSIHSPSAAAIVNARAASAAKNKAARAASKSTPRAEKDGATAMAKGRKFLNNLVQFRGMTGKVVACGSYRNKTTLIVEYEDGTTTQEYLPQVEQYVRNYDCLLNRYNSAPLKDAAGTRLIARHQGATAEELAEHHASYGPVCMKTVRFFEGGRVLNLSKRPPRHHAGGGGAGPRRTTAGRGKVSRSEGKGVDDSDEDCTIRQAIDARKKGGTDSDEDCTIGKAIEARNKGGRATQHTEGAGAYLRLSGVIAYSMGTLHPGLKKSVANTLLDEVLDKMETEVEDTMGANDVPMLKVLDENLLRLQLSDFAGISKVYMCEVTKSRFDEVNGFARRRNVGTRDGRAVVERDGSNISYRHLSILIDVMTCQGPVMASTRHGVNQVDNGPMLRLSFEETVEIPMESRASRTTSCSTSSATLVRVRWVRFAPRSEPRDQLPVRLERPVSDEQLLPSRLVFSPHGSLVLPGVGGGSSPVFRPNPAAYSPYSPSFRPSSPASPAYSPTSPAYSPTSRAYNPTSPAYGPSSPALSELVDVQPNEPSVKPNQHGVQLKQPGVQPDVASVPPSFTRSWKDSLDPMSPGTGGATSLGASSPCSPMGTSPYGGASIPYSPEGPDTPSSPMSPASPNSITSPDDDASPAYSPINQASRSSGSSGATGLIVLIIQGYWVFGLGDGINTAKPAAMNDAARYMPVWRTAVPRGRAKWLG